MNYEKRNNLFQERNQRLFSNTLQDMLSWEYTKGLFAGAILMFICVVIVDFIFKIM